jgi:phage baseplate assembly protein W
MADGTTYGVNFPFRVSQQGYYFSLSQTTDEEIRSSLLHLILTRKGSRYFLPDFGTRIYEFIFDPLDGETFEGIKSEIQEQVEKYIPNLIINDISVIPYLDWERENEDSQEIDNTFGLSYNRGSITTTTTSTLPSNGSDQAPSYTNDDIFRVAGPNTQEYTAKLRIDYVNNNNAFGSREFIIINI